MTKIAIFGLGAIGSILAKYLLKNKNNQLSFFNRSTKTSIQIVFKDQLETYPMQLSKPGETHYDWIIVSLKTYHLAAAKKSISQLIGPQTKIAIFRNGLNLAADFSDVFPSQNILETIIDCSVQQRTDGAYLQLRTPKITLPNLPLAKTFQKLFKGVDLQFYLTKEFKKEGWKKLIESSSLGALQVLAGAPCLIFKNPKILAEYTELINEGIVVANADGINISIDFAKELLKKLKTYPDHKSSSMLADRLAGRPLELEAKIGVIVEIGMTYDVEIPRSYKVYEMLLVL